jgi:6-phosphogluconolactonase
MPSIVDVCRKKLGRGGVRMEPHGSTFLHIYPNPQAMSRGAAEIIDAAARTAIDAKGKFSIALSGGNTPRLLYRMLASDYGGTLPWDRIHFFWGDERFVPADDPLSNYRMAREELLDRIKIPASNIHPIPTDLRDPEKAALAYEHSLHSFFAQSVPTIDLILLGMGEDGHVASLFPGSPGLAEQIRNVIVVRAQAMPPVRISLTLPVINAAKQILVLVAGLKKRSAVRRLFGKGEKDSVLQPAGMLSPAGELHWLLDKAAAGDTLQ